MSDKPVIPVGEIIRKSRLPGWLKWFVDLFRGKKIAVGPVDIQLDQKPAVPPPRTGLDRPYRATPPSSWGPRH